MKFFHHKDLGNHLLQLCPKVVEHPVYVVLSKAEQHMLYGQLVHTTECVRYYVTCS